MSDEKCVLCDDKDYLVPHDVEDQYCDWLAVTDAARKYLEGGSLADNPAAVTFAQVRAADMGWILTESQIVNILVAAELGARLEAAQTGDTDG